MSRSIDPDHFFQTDASAATRARRAAKSGNKNGNPITLQSKILDVVADPFSASCVYVAESAGCIRNINTENKDVSTVYRGPTAPLTSIAVGGEYCGTIYAGCWDKDVWLWDRASRRLVGKYKGHSDFVKAVICARISGKNVLISGGADAKIMVWDTSNGTRIHTLRDDGGTMRAIQFLAIDPIESMADEVVTFSSSSDPQIRSWRISLVSARQMFDEHTTSEPNQAGHSRRTILEHETSVYKLLFDSDEGDLWTASADGTVKRLSRARNWATEETIKHGDYVRAVAVTADWIITAGRDENVKVWDRTTGKLFHIYDGHFEEVTGLVVLDGSRVVSVSIDGTIRVWSLDRKELEKAIMEKKERAKGPPEDVSVKATLMTPEEEAELAELMNDDE